MADIVEVPITIELPVTLSVTIANNPPIVLGTANITGSEDDLGRSETIAQLLEAAAAEIRSFAR